MKVGPSSTAVILDKDWVDGIKDVIGEKDINVTVFGEEFIVVEVNGLRIKDKDTKRLLQELKTHFAEIQTRKREVKNNVS